MPYDNNTPLPTDTIASTTDPIRNNFAFIQTDLQEEHSFNSNLAGVAEGAHKKVSMPNLVGAPALPAGTDGMYYVLAGQAKYLDNASRVYNLTLGDRSANGYQWIGRCLIQWGIVSSITSGTVTYPIAFPQSVFNIQSTVTYSTLDLPNSAANVYVVKSTTTPLTKFNWYYRGSGNGTGFYWMAIGH